MHQQGGTIKEAVESIATGDYVLPAIQREFIWHPDQVCNLFDSVMQGYPFGEFLIWQIEPENVNKFTYYGFVRECSDLNGRHCPKHGPLPEEPISAVLDGQQRLTAFNIGLRGSMAMRRHRGRRNNPDAYPARFLALDLLAQPDTDDDDGNVASRRYAFHFIDPKNFGQSGDSFWFRVSDITRSNLDVDCWIAEQGLAGHQQETARDALTRLYQAICVEKPIYHYAETHQDIEHVLAVFLRRNQGGTRLEYSDMLRGIAVSQWKELDARQEVRSLVDGLKGIGARFELPLTFVMRAGLMLSDIPSVGLRVENFTRRNVAVLEQNWAGIRTALYTTVRLVSSFGFNGGNIQSASSMLPIAYYLYRKGASDEFVDHPAHRADRAAIRDWLVRSMLKSGPRTGIWRSSGLDGLLTALREIIRRESSSHFPYEQIRPEMARRGRPLEFTPEESDGLANMGVGDKRVFALLSLLFPMDFNNTFHIDHVFPKSRFSDAQLRQAGVSEELWGDFRAKSDRIANLQLLPGAENNAKRAMLPAEWLQQTYSNPSERQAHCERHLLGEAPEGMAEFDKFYQARHERLKSRIAELVNAA